jgi:hypothetical protein
VVVCDVLRKVQWSGGKEEEGERARRPCLMHMQAVTVGASPKTYAQRRSGKARATLPAVRKREEEEEKRDDENDSEEAHGIIVLLNHFRHTEGFGRSRP